MMRATSIYLCVCVMTLAFGRSIAFPPQQPPLRDRDLSSSEAIDSSQELNEVQGSIEGQDSNALEDIDGAKELDLQEAHPSPIEAIPISQMSSANDHDSEKILRRVKRQRRRYNQRRRQNNRRGGEAWISGNSTPFCNNFGCNGGGRRSSRMSRCPSGSRFDRRSNRCRRMG